MKPKLHIDRDYLILAAVAVAAFVYYQWITWTQFASNHVYFADVGIISGALSSVWHGQFLVSPDAPDVAGNYFGGHFRPSMFALLPFYALFDHPMVLLTAQNLGLVAGGWLLGLWAFRVFKWRPLAWAFVALYYTNFFIMTIHLANHYESMAMAGMFAMFYSVHVRRPWIFAAGLLWALSIKEDYALHTALFGVALLLDRDKTIRKWGLATIGAAVVWAILAVVVMYASGKAAYDAVGINPHDRYGWMGESFGEILLFMLTRPWEPLLQVFARPPLWILLASVGLLGLADWRGVWVGIAAAAVFLLSKDHVVGNLQYFYSYAAIPFVFWSAVRGASNLIERFGVERPWLPKALAGWIIVVAVFSAPQRTWTDGYRHAPFEVTAHHRAARDIIRHIPPEAAVAAQYDLYARVPWRPELYPLRDYYIDRVDYLLLDAKGRAPDLTPEQLDRIRDAINSPEWKMIAGTDGYMLFRRDSVDDQ